jgi:hypothetical protein
MSDSGFRYKGKDPVYEMNTGEFENMAKDAGFPLEHPTDLKGNSLDMWRAKWVFRIHKKNPKFFVVDDKVLAIFKASLV